MSERLEACAGGLRDWEHGYHGSFIASDDYDTADLAALLREAAAVLRAVEGADIGVLEDMSEDLSYVWYDYPEKRGQRVRLVPLDAAGSAEGRG